MFCISIPIENSQLIWTLMYKDEDVAKAAWSKIAENTTDVVLLADDFGQVARVKCPNLTVALFEDMKLSTLAYAERVLQNERSKIKANQMVSADPGIKAASMMQGPAVFNPVNGSMPRHG